MTEHGRIPGMTTQEMADRIASQPSNRWAAFTNDELDEIAGCLSYTEQNTCTTATPAGATWDQLMDELNAELERRKP